MYPPKTEAEILDLWRMKRYWRSQWFIKNIFWIY